MAFLEGESALFRSLTNELANVPKPMGAALDRLGAGCIQGGCGMFLYQPTEAHNRWLKPYL